MVCEHQIEERVDWLPEKMTTLSSLNFRIEQPRPLSAAVVAEAQARREKAAQRIPPFNFIASDQNMDFLHQRM